MPRKIQDGKIVVSGFTFVRGVPTGEEIRVSDDVFAQLVMTSELTDSLDMLKIAVRAV